MRSIRARLTTYLLAGIGLLIVAAGFALQLNIAHWWEREFDLALTAQARALVTLTEQDRGEVELEFADELMPDFESPSDPHYFELWLEGDKLIERSKSFETDETRSTAALPRATDLAAAPRTSDARLPDGRPGRIVQIDFVPQPHDDDDASSDMPARVDPGSDLRTATLLVARERETLDSRIARLGWLLLVFTVILLATVTGLIAVLLPIGLRPLDRLAREVGNLDAESLDRRIDLGSPPLELVPITEQINDLLTRLETAFTRERQLTSDIAHELKTPIAELRNLSEVGARWPDDPVSARKFFEDAREIGLQMERIVVHLLELARFDEGAAQVRVERVHLADVVAAAWRPLEESAARRRLTFDNRIPAEAVLDTDPERLGLILSNLLGNAVDYSRPGTVVACRFEAAGGRSTLTVSNYPASLDSDDLPLMFDRFWRRDQARTGGRNVGLGLAIVRTYSDLLGLEITATLAPGDLLEIALSSSA